RVLRGVRRRLRRPGAHPGRMGRRVPHRRRGAEDAGRAPAFGLPAAFRAQGTVLARDGEGALAGGAASQCRPARRGRHRASRGAGDADDMSTHDASPEATATAPAPNVHMHAYESATQWTWGAAVAISSVLSRELQAKPRTRLLLSGGSTPAPVYQALAKAPLDWERVDVALVDERWLLPDDPDSNSRLVRESLLQDRAAKARF